MSAKSISLYRPRRWPRITMVVAALSLAAVAVTAAVVAPHFIRYGDNSLPRVVGADAIESLASAQDRFFAANGVYASTVDELDADDAAKFRRRVDLMFRVTTNDDGSAYVAGAVGFSGEHSAIVRADDVNWRGSGDSFDDALRDAGWTERWAAAHGFAALPSTEHVHGAIVTADGKIIELRMDETTRAYTVTTRPIPATGEGSTWQEAVISAGGDPEAFPFERAPGSSPQTARSGAGDVLTVVAAEGIVSARIDFAGSATSAYGDAEVAVREAAAVDLLLDVNESFRCATAFDGNGIQSVTLCQDLQGRNVVWASTGLASTNPSMEAAFTEVGATADWVERHGITLPTVDDLL